MTGEFFKAQGDYLIVVLGTLVVLVAVEWGIRRMWSSARLPIQVWLLTLLLLGAGGWAIQHASSRARAENEALVGALAPTYAFELERMGHARLTTGTPADDPLYLSMIEAEVRWQKLNPFAHDIYTMRKLPGGTNVLIVDSESDYDRNGRFEGPTERRTPIGKLYPNPDFGLEKAFRGEANFDPEIIADEWGTWVSAFVPMRDSEGRVEAVLGVDFDAQTWVSAISQARRTVIWHMALVLAIILVSGTSIALLRADIARRSEVEDQLRKSDERMQLAIRQMPLGFIEWNTNAEVVIWNPAAEKIFSFTAAEVQGQAAIPWIVAPPARAQVAQVWADLMRNAGSNHTVNGNVTKDGSAITCEWFNTPLVESDGKVVAVFSIVRDITERLKLETHLRQADRLNAVGQLAAGVAHDFNNILTIITGHVGVLLAQNQADDTVRTGLKNVEAAALRAAGLTRQLLAFSHQQVMFPRVLQLGESVKTTAAMLSRALTAAVNFKVNVAEHIPPIEADPAMLEQIITNLVLNARDALPEGGNITVSVKAVHVSTEAAAQNSSARPGLAVRLGITDTGTGIPPENLPRIFEPFFTTKPAGRGTGLGLSVVHGIVEQHHGWITVDSTPGKGTTFNVFFPPSDNNAADASSENPATIPVRVAPKSGHTILLVEDEQAVGDLARSILESAGYRVLLACDGHEALQLWEKHRQQIDLLLTDMVMPNGLTGRKLSLRLLHEQPDLPVIYASGYSIELAAPDFCESERMVFLPKPYLAGELIATVRRCLHNGG